MAPGPTLNESSRDAKARGWKVARFGIQAYVADVFVKDGAQDWTLNAFDEKKERRVVVSGGTAFLVLRPDEIPEFVK